MKNVKLSIEKESSSLRLKISAEIEIILHTLTLVSIIKVLKETFLSVAADVLKKLLLELDNMWLREKESDVKVCRFVRRTLKTSIGDIPFKFRQAKKNGIYFSPLLELLGLEKYQRTTEDLKELMFSALLYASFRKSLKIGGYPFSLFALWSSMQKEGIKYRKKVDDVIYYYSEGVLASQASEKDFAIVMMDGIHIRHIKRRHQIIVKVARLVVARWRDGKYIFEPIRVVATTRKKEVFLRRAYQFFDVVARLSLIPRIVVVTDADSMGRDFCKYYNGKVAPAGRQGVWQLDWWHLWDYVHKGCKFEKDLEKKIWDLLIVEKVDEALAILEAYRDTMKELEEKLKGIEEKIVVETSPQVGPRVFWSATQLENLEKLIRYIRNNRDGIYGVKAFQGEIPAEYLPFGNGPVERLQAVMIAYRMKGQGKHWSIEGAENLIALLSKEWNGLEVDEILEEGLKNLAEWEKMNQKAQIKEEKIEILPRSKKRMDFSPLPTSTIYLLQRGKVESFYRPLLAISHLKILPSVLDRAGRRDAVLCH